MQLLKLLLMVNQDGILVKNKCISWYIVWAFEKYESNHIYKDCGTEWYLLLSSINTREKFFF